MAVNNQGIPTGNVVQYPRVSPSLAPPFDLKTIAIVILIVIILIESAFLFSREDSKENGKEMLQPPPTLPSLLNTAAGVDTNNIFYQHYTACVNSCNQCPQACETSYLQMRAVEEKDVDVCGSLEASVKQDCIDRVYFEQARATQDKTICEKITGLQKEGCLVGVALSLAEAKQDVSYCASLSENQRDACEQTYYLDTAIKTNNEALCAKIENKGQQQICEQVVQVQLQTQQP